MSKLTEILKSTNVLLMLEAMEKGFVLSPEEMKAVRDLEKVCHDLSQVDDMRKVIDLMDTVSKAVEEPLFKALLFLFIFSGNG